MAFIYKKHTKMYQLGMVREYSEDARKTFSSEGCCIFFSSEGVAFFHFNSRQTAEYNMKPEALI